jgi:hypothetical protein
MPGEQMSSNGGNKSDKGQHVINRAYTPFLLLLMSF